jgi:hypothetical protein
MPDPLDLWRLRLRAKDLPEDWVTLIAASHFLHEAPDATLSVVLDRVFDTKDKVLSRQQGLTNKYARISARNLIPWPYKIRRVRDGEGYVIEAARDLTPVIEAVMISWPGAQEDDE